MEKMEVVPDESKDNEITPLVTESKNDGETTSKKTSLSHLASELSEVSLEVANAVTSTTIDGSANQPEAESSTPDTDPSADPTEESEMIVDEVPDSQPPTDEAQDGSETESPQDSEVEDPRWMDRTMLALILEILLLVFPISMAYFGIAYFKECEGGEKLPMLLIVLAFLSALTLMGRILINVAKKMSIYDSEVFPPISIYAGEFMVMVLFIAEVSYMFNMDVLLCNDTLYLYSFYMNNIAAAFIIILLFVNMKKIARRVRILRD